MFIDAGKRERRLHLMVPVAFDGGKVCAVFDNGFFYPDMFTDMQHSHSEFEAHYCTEGDYAVTCNGVTYRLDQDTACIVPPRAAHTTGDARQGTRKYSFSFSFSGDAPEGGHSFYGMFFSALNRLTSPIVLERAAPLRHYMDEMYATLMENPDEGRLLAPSLLTCFLIRLYYIMSPRALARENIDLYKAYEITQTKDITIRDKVIENYFVSNYTGKASIDELADALHLCARQVNRILRERYASTFSAMLVDMRLSEAKRLLAGSAQSVEAVAYSVGYSSMSSFYTAFHRSCGMTPLEYRKRAHDCAGGKPPAPMPPSIDGGDI